MKLEHDGEQGHSGSDHSETGLWRVDLEQTTTQCDGSYSVQTVASIAGEIFLHTGDNIKEDFKLLSEISSTEWDAPILGPHSESECRP